MTTKIITPNNVAGEFVTIDGETYYAIHHVDQMPSFFVSLVSHSDHWLFVSSTGGLTAGRVSPETALFPYVPVDQIHDSALNTGCKTVIRILKPLGNMTWQPFNTEHEDRFQISRNLFKNLLGNKLCFEEINHDLQLAFRYTWSFSEEFGFCRHCQLKNLSEHLVSVSLVDGLQNILPAGTPRYTQTHSSNLVDAYKWSELEEATGLASFILYSGITDRAEPSESLHANTLFSLGLDEKKVLLSSDQLKQFIQGENVKQEKQKRGVRGAYLLQADITLQGYTERHWDIVANVEQTQNQVVSLNNQLANTIELKNSIVRSIEQGSDELARFVGKSDGFQSTHEPLVSTHHYANTLFNVLRGGIFDDQYRIAKADFIETIMLFNKVVYKRHACALDELTDIIDLGQLIDFSKTQSDPQLERLVFEYLPITFGRRHGDPSRPWNQFELRFKDEEGKRILSYQGNWRDIFQNWEALLVSYPSYIEQVIAKFVNASTIDGYNPYRITKQGVDWEVEEPEDPWSYIGYWGDHQIIYLLKLLELSEQFHPNKLQALLTREIFSYANVPYKIKPFEAILENAKDTVVYDEALAIEIESRVGSLGNDGKLVLDSHGKVYQVNLFEKLLVTLLSKLGNLIVGGGIWLNTQRPEWNDANNALVGQGLSMVTLFYMRRYITFMRRLMASSIIDEVSLSKEVADWLRRTVSALNAAQSQLLPDNLLPLAYELIVDLGNASSHYRCKVYEQGGFSGKATVDCKVVDELLSNGLSLLDSSIEVNLRKDGLYHAYNLLSVDKHSLVVSRLYPMLEGQVAALSSGALSAVDSCHVLDALFTSEIYRNDQKTFMLYPDRKLRSFLDKNRVPDDLVEKNALLSTMTQLKDERVISRDDNGCYRFHPDISNVGDLNKKIDDLSSDYGDVAYTTRQELSLIYERVFNHKEFTGRSGGMFGFEGLGCIYWHMIAKLLLATQEQFFAAVRAGEEKSVLQRLGGHYYAIREGIGFNKTPQKYGAFPCDPYSHTPKHAGAQQPGMTGQVKEEILTRFGELGIQVHKGQVTINPQLLRAQEFNETKSTLKYLDISDQWQTISVSSQGLAFTWCQVPFVYSLSTDDDMTITVLFRDSSESKIEGNALSYEDSQMLFERSDSIRQINIAIPSNQLFIYK
jgi:hypothetical protein